MRPENGEAENVRVYTRSGRVIEGTFQLCNASVHVNGEYANAKRSYDTCEVVLDEDVKNDIAVAARYGIAATTLEGIMTVKGQGSPDSAGY